MKKLRMTLAASILLFLTAIVLQSCLDDWDDKYDTLFAVGTVKVIEGKDYYFSLDEGSKLYPSDTTYVHDYAVIRRPEGFHLLPRTGRETSRLRIQCPNKAHRKHSDQRHLLHACRKGGQYRRRQHQRHGFMDYGRVSEHQISILPQQQRRQEAHAEPGHQ